MIHPHNTPCRGHGIAASYQQTVDRVLAQNKSRAEGLRSAEAAERLASFGPNALPEKKSKPAWLRFSPTLTMC
jgi:magnesium-transporting ATPase (P-type)